jgi:glucose/arabinose dehydrogenase
MRSTAATAAIVAVALAVTSCAPADPPTPTVSVIASAAPSGSATASSPSSAAPDAGSIEAPAVVATGLDAPWSIAFTDSGAAVVAERDTATIVELVDGQARPLAQIGGVAHGGEGGLLGLAIGDGHLYAAITTADDNRVLRMPLSGEPGSLVLGEPETVVEGLPAAGNHNGGRLAFGPDGMLYVTTGDAGQPATAQDPASLGGKILRLEPDGAIPADNPFPDSPVYSLGHRNPQGIAWTADGTLWATEFGQDTWDELNRIEPGENYGWPIVEGSAGDPRFADPMQQWPPSEASPSGMAHADGRLWIANLRGQSLREVDPRSPGESTVHWLAEHGRMRDVVETPDGALWVLTNNTDGRGDPREGDDRILAFRP